jgi:D-aminopeptidase
VKWATSRMSADCQPPQITQENIQAAAQRAVSQLAAGEPPAPYQLAPPIQVEIEFFNSDMADRVMLLPQAQRGGARRVAFTAADMPAAYTTFRSAVAQARS